MKLDIDKQKSEFINQFVTSFLGAWCANNYDDACMKGQQGRLYNPPIEDAFDLAETIYDKHIKRT